MSAAPGRPLDGGAPAGAPRFARRLRRKLLKRWAQDAFFPGLRLVLLRWAGVAIGRDVYIADGLVIIEELADRGGVTIGDRASFGPRVTLVVSSHPNASRLRDAGLARKAPIVVEEDAWIGAGAVVLPGVRIGRGAVVGAGSVVTRDVPPGHVVAGQPARTVRVLAPPYGPGAALASDPTDADLPAVPEYTKQLPPSDAGSLAGNHPKAPTAPRGSRRTLSS